MRFHRLDCAAIHWKSQILTKENSLLHNRLIARGGSLSNASMLTAHAFLYLLDCNASHANCYASDKL